MRGADPGTVAWVSSNIVPFEAELRHKLRYICKGQGEVDDLVQDVYYRLLQLPSVEHIEDPRSYLFQIARNIVIDQMRRKSVVSIETVHNLDELAIADNSPSPERAAMASAELKWVLGIIANLPERCRDVFRMRKVYGLSQAETANNLGLSENIVEKETMRGMHIISDIVARVGLSGYDSVRGKNKPGRVAAPAKKSDNVGNR
jgi:RNA polymerase sigma-70 factor (ECF subfamily)